MRLWHYIQILNICYLHAQIFPRQILRVLGLFQDLFLSIPIDGLVYIGLKKFDDTKGAEKNHLIRRQTRPWPSKKKRKNHWYLFI